MGLKKGIKLQNIKMIDEAPTFAKLLGVELNNTDGKALTEILK